MKNEITIEQNVIAEAYKAEDGLDRLFESLQSQVSGLVFDMSDKKSREDCGSVAYKVSRSKTAVDDFGKDLVADIKAKVKIVDNQRKSFREKCDELRDHIRAPLDAYEAELQEIKDSQKNKILEITNHLQVQYQDPESVQSAIEQVKSIKIDHLFGEFEGDAKLAKYETLEELDFIKIQVTEKCFQEEKQKKEMIAHATAAAEQRAKEADDRAKQAEINADIRAKDAELRAKQAEDRAFKEIEERQRMDQERKEADVEHKRAVNRAILDALCSWGALDEDQAKELIKKIHKCEIPNLKIQY